ncbi:hypothetical protein B0H14DRAFT_3605235 [Mycena olivaceomarginata]|nr:hypothetical protein B0H14DRAFT_3605235 [Mycena olivaceomarginata]
MSGSLVIAPATLSYQTDWACVETTTPGVLFRKDEALAGYGFYDSITFTATSVMFSRPDSAVFKSEVVPFLIIADGNPIDIKITRGRDRDALEDHRGRASVKIGDNSYQNDVTSSQTNERIFYNCPLPLTTTFIPRNPGTQPSQLVTNFTKNVQNVYHLAGNSGGVPFGPDPEARWGYILPGINSSILVIYFDAEQCQMLFVDHGTIVDSKIVEKVKADGSAWQSGGFVLAQAGSATFQAIATFHVISENLIEIQVSLSGVLHHEAAPDIPIPNRVEVIKIDSDIE